MAVRRWSEAEQVRREQSWLRMSALLSHPVRPQKLECRGERTYGEKRRAFAPLLYIAPVIDQFSSDTPQCAICDCLVTVDRLAPDIEILKSKLDTDAIR